MKPIQVCFALTMLFAAACASATQPMTPASSLVSSSDVSLPLELQDGKYIYVQGEINGTPTDIVIDSGAGITVVDRALAERLGITGVEEITAKGVGGTRNVKLAEGVTIHLGSATLPPMTVAILDLEEVHEKLGRAMPVILGQELFHAFPVTIDYAARRVILHDPAHFESPRGATRVPAKSIGEGHVAIQAQLEDLPIDWYTVDTGSGGSVDFHVPYVEANGLLQRYPKQGAQQMSGVGGSLTERSVVARSFTLAGQKFQSVPVALATKTQGAFASSVSSGTIGSILLSRFVVTFDLAAKCMYFEPNAGVDAPFEKDRLGLSCDVHSGIVRVSFLSPGGPADESGLIVGDEIVGVDGEALAGFALIARLREVKHANAGTLVQLTLRDGTVRRVTLADYF